MFLNIPRTVYEFQLTSSGDNTILALQAGRALVSSYIGATQGAQLPSGVAYLSNEATLTAKSDGSLSLDDIERGWDCVAANAAKKAAYEYAGWRKNGKSKDEAHEACSSSRFIAAKLHTFGYIFKMFKAAVTEMPPSAETSTLTTVAKLYGLWQLEQNEGVFLKYGFLSPENTDEVQRQVDQLCAEVRKYAIPLIDSFALSDHIINSPLGKWDGSVYETYFEQVRAQNPLPKEHPYFKRLIKPLLEREPFVHEDIEGEMDLDNELQEMQARMLKSKSKKAPKQE